MRAACSTQDVVPRMRPPSRLRHCCVATASSIENQTIYISSAQNPAVKHCVKLRQSGKYRQETGTALISGRDLVAELAQHAVFRALVGLEDVQLPDIAADRHVAVTRPVMQKITGLETVASDQLAAEVVLPQPADLLGVPVGQLSRVLVLDGVQDPGNLGTLLRTALALGWQAAVLLPGCCDPFNDKALRASRGAVFKMPLAQMSVQQWQALVQGHGLVALAADPDREQAQLSISGGSHGGGSHGSGSSGSGSSSSGGTSGSSKGGSSKLADQQQQAGSLGGLQQQLGQLRVCLCLGAEGQGLSEAVRQQCRSVSIPQSGGLMESLNVSAAGAILMFALSRGAAPLLAELASLSE